MKLRQGLCSVCCRTHNAKAVSHRESALSIYLFSGSMNHDEPSWRSISFSSYLPPSSPASLSPSWMSTSSSLSHSLLCHRCFTIPLVPSHHCLLLIFSALVPVLRWGRQGRTSIPSSQMRKASPKEVNELCSLGQEHDHHTVYSSAVVLRTHCPGQGWFVSGFWSKVLSFFVLL